MFECGWKNFITALAYLFCQAMLRYMFCIALFLALYLLMRKYNFCLKISYPDWDMMTLCSVERPAGTPTSQNGAGPIFMAVGQFRSMVWSRMNAVAWLPHFDRRTFQSHCNCVIIGFSLQESFMNGTDPIPLFH